MRIYILVTSLLLLHFVGRSQLSYEDLEKYSKSISEIQVRSGSNYNANRKITYPKENFKIYFSTGLATFAQFSGENGSDTLMICENLDFSQAEVVFFNSKYPGILTVVFNNPKHISAKFIKDEKEIYSRNYDGMNFTYDKSSESDKLTLFKDLTELILLLKINKGILSKDNAEIERNAWKLAVESNSMAGYKEFSKKFHSSVFKEEAIRRRFFLDPAKEIKNINKGEFYLGMKKQQFENIITQRVQKQKSEIDIIASYLKTFNMYQDMSKENDYYIGGSFVSWSYDIVLGFKKNKKYYTLKTEMDRIRGNIDFVQIPTLSTLIPESQQILLDQVLYENGLVYNIKYEVILPESFSDLKGMKDRFIQKFGEPADQFSKRADDYDSMNRIPIGEAGTYLEFKTQDNILLTVKIFKTDDGNGGLENPGMIIRIVDLKLIKK